MARAPKRNKKAEELGERVCKNLRLARFARGMTQKEVADRAGVDKNQVAQWERGERKPQIGYLHILAGVFQWPTDWFYEDEPRFADDGRKAAIALGEPPEIQKDSPHRPHLEARR